MFRQFEVYYRLIWNRSQQFLIIIYMNYNRSSGRMKGHQAPFNWLMAFYLLKRQPPWPKRWHRWRTWKREKFSVLDLLLSSKKRKLFSSRYLYLSIISHISYWSAPLLQNKQHLNHHGKFDWKSRMWNLQSHESDTSSRLSVLLVFKMWPLFHYVRPEVKLQCNYTTDN